MGDYSGLAIIFRIFAGLVFLVAIAWMFVAILTIIGLWRIFEKAGRPGWYSIIPFYNLYALTELVGMDGLLALVCLIPLGAFVWYIIISFRLAQAFGKDNAYGLGVMLLPYIFIPVLGLGKAQYVLGGYARPEAPRSNQAAPNSAQSTSWGNEQSVIDQQPVIKQQPSAEPILGKSKKPKPKKEKKVDPWLTGEA